MATFAEVSDLRDWCEDTLGEFLKRMELLDGDEPKSIMDELDKAVTCVNRHGVEVITCLEQLLVLKKKDEFTP
jgi:hypothetical protein